MGIITGTRHLSNSTPCGRRQQAGRGGVLVRRLRSVLQSASVASGFSPFSTLRCRHRVLPRLFPLAVRPRALRCRFAVGLGSGGGGQPSGFACAPFSPFALRSAVLLTHLAPSPFSQGLFKQAAPAFFRPQLSPVFAVGRLSAASATVSTTGGAGAACFHRP